MLYHEAQESLNRKYVFVVGKELSRSLTSSKATIETLEKGVKYVQV